MYGSLSLFSPRCYSKYIIQYFTAPPPPYKGEMCHIKAQSGEIPNAASISHVIDDSRELNLCTS